MREFKSMKEFGLFLGLTEIEMEVGRQKRALIQKIAAARAQKKLSQAKLAKLLGTKQPAIARMEAGQVSHVSLDFLLRAVLVLGLTHTFKPLKDVA